MSLAIALHVLSAVIWVGGMFFAYMAMRPAVVEVVEASQRGHLWSKTLERFFRWVWLAVVLLLVTGYWMIFSVFGGMAGAGQGENSINSAISRQPSTDSRKSLVCSLLTADC